MAGHSKWANIKHKKAKEDAKRGKVFTKLIKELVVAAKQGGGDPDMNPRLRLAISKAKAANLPKDTMESAVRRGAGDIDGEDYEEILYEGYGPGGVAVMVECLTDNRNRTVADVRHAFTKHGGNLGTSGSVSYLFTQIGMLTFAEGSDESTILEAALEAGAEDVVVNDDTSIDVKTTPETFVDVQEAMSTAGLTPEHAELTQVASTDVSLDLDAAEKMIKLLDRLEDLDDVQSVSSNADIADEIIAQLS